MKKKGNLLTTDCSRCSICHSYQSSSTKFIGIPRNHFRQSIFFGGNWYDNAIIASCASAITAIPTAITLKIIQKIYRVTHSFKCSRIYVNFESSAKLQILMILQFFCGFFMCPAKLLKLNRRNMSFFYAQVHFTPSCKNSFSSGERVAVYVNGFVKICQTGNFFAWLLTVKQQASIQGYFNRICFRTCQVIGLG